MRVKFSLVGHPEHGPLDWRELPEVPREGDTVYVPNLGEVEVRTVVWYPWGSEDESRPFVYVVIGPPRRDRP